jgi:PBP1b-binding outer membrane lipoprotein LpoB
MKKILMILCLTFLFVGCVIKDTNGLQPNRFDNEIVRLKDGRIIKLKHHMGNTYVIDEIDTTGLRALINE